MGTTFQAAPGVPAITSGYDHHLDRLIKARCGRGQWRPLLYDLSPRWQWWGLALLTRRLPPLPYPKIEFAEHFPDGAAPMRMIRQCLKVGRFDELVDWMLYRFGSPDSRRKPNVDFEPVFDLKVMLDEPGDWLGHYYEINLAAPGMRAAHGFFTTPMSLCSLMAGMLKPELTDSLHEPCVGTGRMLMAGSNYCLHLSGQDVNPMLCKIATINGWMYMPSLVMPCREIAVSKELKFDRKLKNVIGRKELTYEPKRNPRGGLAADDLDRGTLRRPPRAGGDISVLPSASPDRGG